MKTNIHSCSYFGDVLELEMFQAKGVDKVITHVLYSLTFFFFLKSCRL